MKDPVKGQSSLDPGFQPLMLKAKGREKVAAPGLCSERPPWAGERKRRRRRRGMGKREEEGEKEEGEDGKRKRRKEEGEGRREEG